MFRRATRREFHKQLGSLPLLGSLATVPGAKTASRNPAAAPDLKASAKESQNAVASGATSTTPFNPVRVGTASQLLIDDHVVDDVWMIRRSPEMPVKHLENPTPANTPC
jgi:hypothetical protein